MVNKTNVKRRQVIKLKNADFLGRRHRHVRGRSVAHTSALGAKIILDYYAGVIRICPIDTGCETHSVQKSKRLQVTGLFQHWKIPRVICDL